MRNGVECVGLHYQSHIRRPAFSHQPKSLENHHHAQCLVPASLRHILVGCKASLSQGRLTWRHNEVLKCFAAEIENKRVVTNATPYPGQVPTGDIVQHQTLCLPTPDKWILSRPPRDWKRSQPVDQLISLWSACFNRGSIVIKKLKHLMKFGTQLMMCQGLALLSGHGRENSYFGKNSAESSGIVRSSPN